MLLPRKGARSPAAHPSSPVATQLEPSRPVPHPGAPGGVELEEVATGHPSSPTVVTQVGQGESLHTPDSERVPEAREAVRSLMAAATRLVQPTPETDGYGRDARFCDALRPFGDWVFGRYFRTVVEGSERLPEGPCLLVANHAGALPLDGPMLCSAVNRVRHREMEARWLLEDQVMFAPGLGRVLARAGAVRASPSNALALLRAGHDVAVFPEGIHGISKSFSERYQLQRFGRAGYVKLALEAGAPIVPVAIVGSEETSPLLGRIPTGRQIVAHIPITTPPFPVQWRIRFGSPIDWPAAGVPHAGLAPPSVERLNELVRAAVTTMLKEMLASREGLF